MFAASVIAVISLVVFGLATATEKAENIRRSVAESFRAQLAIDLQRAIVDHRDQKGVYPSSVQDLDPAVTRNMASVTSGSIAYRLASTSFTNPDWPDAKRAVLYAIRPGFNSKLQADKIFAGNGCGSASDANWETAAAWCPPAGLALYSAVLDPRPAMAREIAAQRRRLSRTLYRLANFYNGTRTLPTHGAHSENGNLDLVPVGETSDVDLSKVAYKDASLESNTCAVTGDKLMLYYSPGGITGQQPLPLGCEDVFDVWGKGVRYQRPTKTSIRLVAVSPYTNDEGKRVLIVQELDLGV